MVFSVTILDQPAATDSRPLRTAGEFLRSCIAVRRPREKRRREAPEKDLRSRIGAPARHVRIACSRAADASVVAVALETIPPRRRNRTLPTGRPEVPRRDARLSFYYLQNTTIRNSNEP